MRKKEESLARLRRPSSRLLPLCCCAVMLLILAVISLMMVKCAPLKPSSSFIFFLSFFSSRARSYCVTSLDISLVFNAGYFLMRSDNLLSMWNNSTTCRSVAVTQVRVKAIESSNKYKTRTWTLTMLRFLLLLLHANAQRLIMKVAYIIMIISLYYDAGRPRRYTLELESHE